MWSIEQCNLDHVMEVVPRKRFLGRSFNIFDVIHVKYRGGSYLGDTSTIIHSEHQVVPG